MFAPITLRAKAQTLNNSTRATIAGSGYVRFLAG
jgi:hypothetical protein